MEFIIKQSVLKDELGFVQGIVEKKKNNTRSFKYFD